MHISIVSVNLLVIVIFLLSPTTEAQQPTYRYHFCPNTTTFSLNSTYRANRHSLLDLLSSIGTHGDGFYNTTSGRGADMVYGLFLCLADLNTSVCQACVTFATTDIPRLCPVETTAVVWYDECLLRYSNQNIFSARAEEPAVIFVNTQNITKDLFNQAVEASTRLTRNAISSLAESATKKFATTEVKISNYLTLYTLGQCTPDLSSADCNRCLQFATGNLARGSQGGRVLCPSCYVRYEDYAFYNQTVQIAVAPPPLPPAPDKPNNSNRSLVLVATLSATFGLLVVSLSGFIIWRRRSSPEDTGNSQGGQFLDMVEGRIPYEYSRETFGGENGDRSQEFPSIQLDILHAATNHFSDEMMLGEGGFGPVYKGILPDGKEIAVKRLSRTSGQGLVEFKNEVMLIARLQHRNLVRLLGCCLEKNEKLLVYEFMPNKSLDVFLFNSKFAVQLDWQKRFNIIKGIARGILYLHEDSRLRISDFGMARIFEDKNEANTNRVVGTYGYMAPEYAMQGSGIANCRIG
ncbi:hypothetical protein V6N12_001328 [Hibiscus sabdariffa]|uniref:Cysteine-rich receptor-like protein kinase 25 n=1 Tax=Hibiscus sabdariffa TaxID=183260 RepID=A0ABR1ZNJ2_9ROSI